MKIVASIKTMAKLTLLRARAIAAARQLEQLGNDSTLDQFPDLRATALQQAREAKALAEQLQREIR